MKKDHMGFLLIVTAPFFVLLFTIAFKLGASIELKTMRVFIEEKYSILIAERDAHIATLNDRLIILQESLTFTGKASWYGTNGEHGRLTASGKIFDMSKMTAAAKRLPFGTYWTVTRLDTGESCNVIITDDGPNVYGRLIDLSYAAAKQINMIDAGVVNVKIAPAVR